MTASERVATGQKEGVVNMQTRSMWAKSDLQHIFILVYIVFQKFLSQH